MAEKNLSVFLTDLKVNKENFRHSPLNNEKEAIHYLIEEDYDSYLRLAKMMSKDCRSFHILILCKNDNFILMDGNRRVSVLKVFDNPELIPKGKNYNDLRELCLSKGSLNIENLNADVYYDSVEEDRENLMEALNELHIHDNKTKKNWNALSQYRASCFIGASIKHSWMKVLEFYGYSDDEIIRMTYRKTDIFSRFLRKKQLKILDNGKLNYENDVEIVKALCQIIKDGAYYSDMGIQKINTRTEKPIIEAILDDIIQKYSFGQEQMQFNDKDSGVNTNNSKELSKTSSRDITLIPGASGGTFLTSKVKFSNLRDTIISEKQKEELYMIDHPSVNQIAQELFSLKLSVFPLTSSIILRSFLQYSFEWYLDKKEQRKTEALHSTVMRGVNLMFNEGLIDKNTKSKIKIMIESDNLINLLNETTHDYTKDPTPKTVLIDFYDVIHPVIKLIYSSNK